VREQRAPQALGAEHITTESLVENLSCSIVLLKTRGSKDKELDCRSGCKAANLSRAAGVDARLYF